jgi:hypothetical protein
MARRTAEQSTRKPFRFTKIHRRLSEGVKQLIDLNNLEEQNDDLTAFILKVKDLLKLVTGERYEYDEKEAKFTTFLQSDDHFLTEDEFFDRQFVDIQDGDDILVEQEWIPLKSAAHESEITFDAKQVLTFRNIMSSLRHTIVQGITTHFFPQTWIDIIKTNVEPAARIEGVTISQKFINKEAGRAVRQQWYQKGEIFPIINNPKIWKAKKPRFEISSAPSRIYEVGYFSSSDFGKLLFDSESIVPYVQTSSPRKSDAILYERGRFAQIPAIPSRKWKTFIEIVRSLLVLYYLEFGSFERIKICGYQPCSKLFLEEKSGEKHFCSSLCRVKDNQSKIDPEKFHCQKRQNAWIDNRLNKVGGKSVAPYHLSYSECDKCSNYVNSKYPEGGQCPIAKEMNLEGLKKSCRAGQHTWIKKRLAKLKGEYFKVHDIPVSECIKCSDYVSSKYPKYGQCRVLKEKNVKAFKRIGMD